MGERGLALAPALQLAPLLKWADLDGSLLLAHDPYHGLDCSAGRLAATTGPGLGVTRRDA